MAIHKFRHQYPSQKTTQLNSNFGKDGQNLTHSPFCNHYPGTRMFHTNPLMMGIKKSSEVPFQVIGRVVQHLRTKTPRGKRDVLGTPFSCIPSLKPTVCPWKWMVEKLLSFWEGLSSGVNCWFQGGYIQQHRKQQIPCVLIVQKNLSRQPL